MIVFNNGQLINTYSDAEIEFNGCIFDSYSHWCIVEIGESSIFSKGNNYDVLIDIISKTHKSRFLQNCMNTLHKRHIYFCIC